MIIKSVAELMSDREVYTIAPEATVVKASQVMRDRDIGALPVMSEDRLVGILSERDVVRRVVAEVRDADALTVADVMTPDPKTITPGASLADAMMVMLDGKFRHVPIVENGKLLAMMSIRDVPTDYRQMNERYLEYTLAAAE